MTSGLIYYTIPFVLSVLYSFQFSFDRQFEFPITSQRERQAFVAKVISLKGIAKMVKLKEEVARPDQGQAGQGLPGQGQSDRTSNKYNLSLEDFVASSEQAHIIITGIINRVKNNYLSHIDQVGKVRHVPLVTDNMSLVPTSGGRPLVAGEGFFAVIWVARYYDSFVAIKGNLKAEVYQVVQEMTNLKLAHDILPGYATRYVGLLVMGRKKAAGDNRIFIVTSFEGITTESTVSLSIEEAVVMERKTTVPVISAKEWETIILEILDVCHKMERAGFSHSDFHSGNILLQFKQDGHLTIKVIDFANFTPLEYRAFSADDMCQAVSTIYKIIKILRKRDHEKYEPAYEKLQPMLSSWDKDELIKETGGFVPGPTDDNDKPYDNESDCAAAAQFNKRDREVFFRISGNYLVDTVKDIRMGWRLKKASNNQRMSYKNVSYLNFTADEIEKYNTGKPKDLSRFLKTVFNS